MGLVRKEVPPPDLKKDDVVEVKILSIVYPIESKYKDATGQPRKQVDFHIMLENGYVAHVYVAFYQSPSERSVLGALIQTLEKLTNITYGKGEIDNFMKDLQNWGRVYVRVAGFRTWNQKEYPKFKMFPGKLPPRQVTLKEQAPSPTPTMDEFLKQTEGWPEERKEDYLKYLKDTNQLVPS